MYWNCNNCKIFFERKPTYTTTCPECKNQLVPTEGNANNYRVYGESMFKKGICVSCCKKAGKNSSFKLKKPMNFNETEMSDRVHKKCYEEANEYEKKWYNLEGNKNEKT